MGYIIDPRKLSVPQQVVVNTKDIDFLLKHLPFNYRGDWDNTSAYKFNDFVFYNGSSYVQKTKENVVGVEPTNTAYWQIIAEGIGSDGNGIYGSTDTPVQQPDMSFTILKTSLINPNNLTVQIGNLIIPKTPNIWYISSIEEGVLTIIKLIDFPSNSFASGQTVPNTFYGGTTTINDSLTKFTDFEEWLSGANCVTTYVPLKFLRVAGKYVFAWSQTRNIPEPTVLFDNTSIYNYIQRGNLNELLALKQNKLTAGNNITIVNDVISSTSSGEKWTNIHTQVGGYEMQLKQSLIIGRKYRLTYNIEDNTGIINKNKTEVIFYYNDVNVFRLISQENITNRLTVFVLSDYIRWADLDEPTTSSDYGNLFTLDILEV